MQDYYNLFQKNGRLYQACWNRFLIVLIDEDWQNNTALRKALSIIGKEQMVDSVLVLSGNPWRSDLQGYHCRMSVYEPRANSISVMCGNGIRAVYQYWIDNGFFPVDTFLIKTESGLREVFFIKDSLFKANMGSFSLSVDDLKGYVRVDKVTFSKNGQFNNISFGSKINDVLADFDIDRCIIGVTGDLKEGKINGEPHLIFFLRGVGSTSLEWLRMQTMRLGKMFTQNKEIFPFEINTSLAIEDHNRNLLLCTYERGVYYVTKSCGSAGSVAGAYFLNHQKKNSVAVETLGGILRVEIDAKNRVFLTGSASSIQN